MNLSAFIIRDIIKDKILNNTHHELLYSLTPLPKFPESTLQRHLLWADNLKFKYAYYYTHLIALIYAKKQYSAVRYKKTGETNEEAPSIADGDKGKLLPMVEVLMQRDMEDFNFLYAAVAWLTLDDFRWHELPEFAHIREDLSYGLVLDYPDLLLPYGSVLVKHNLGEALTTLTEDQQRVADFITRQLC